MESGEVVIIPKEDKYVSYKTLDGYHTTYLKKYAHENNINIPNIDEITLSGPMSYLFSKEGFVVILIENTNMIISLPEQITKNQYNWFSGMYKHLSKFKINFSYLENGQIVYFKDEEDISHIKDFYKYIKKNLKKEKESENNEYRRNI